MRKGKMDAEYVEALREKQRYKEYDFVDCNVNTNYEIREGWGIGKIRTEEKDQYAIREADRSDMFDPTTGAQVGSDVVKLYNKAIWKKMMEMEEKSSGSVFGGRPMQILHDPTKQEEEVKKVGRPKKTEE